MYVVIDVGRGKHRTVALARTGKVAFTLLPNDEAKLRAALQHLKPQGTVFVSINQPA